MVIGKSVKSLEVRISSGSRSTDRWS